MFISEYRQKLVSIATLSMASSKGLKRFRERGHFVCGRRTRRPRKINDGMTTCCIALPWKPTIQCMEADVYMAAKL